MLPAMSATLEQIETAVRDYNPGADVDELAAAYQFAIEAHKGQTRKSGEPFVNHPLEVGLILAELRMDTATLKAGLLHDVVEDSEATLKQVRERFGDEVASLVDGVTKLGRIKFESLEEAQSQNMRKMVRLGRIELKRARLNVLAIASYLPQVFTFIITI